MTEPKRDIEADPIIETSFSYHKPPNSEVAATHKIYRDACKALAYDIKALVPEGREQALAITKLEEVMMWGNAGIARQGK